MESIDLKELLEAGCHFGHQVQRSYPKMKPYLYGARDGVHIFDLVQTKEAMEKAADFARSVAAAGGKIVFVGTKRQAREIINEEAKKAGMPRVFERWLGGTITNWEEIKKRIGLLKEMRQKREKGEYKKYTKKEQILLDRRISRLEKFFGGLETLEEIPAALFVVDIKREATAVDEARAKNIPVIAIVDSNCNPDLVTHVIPANDDAVGSIKLITQYIAEAVREGREAWERKQAGEKDQAGKKKKSKKTAKEKK